MTRCGPATSRSRATSQDALCAMTHPAPWPPDGPPAERLDRERRGCRSGTERCPPRDRWDGDGRLRSLIVGMPDAQRAKGVRLHDGSDVGVRVEGPRRGPEPREDRPNDRWKRWSSVHIHLRSNASKVLHHAVLARTSSPVTVAVRRRELRGKRTPWRQRSWRHDAAAGGGNPPGGTKRAARSRRSRHRLHIDHRKVAGGGCRFKTGRKVGVRQRPDETQRTPGSAAGCNKPASPSPASLMKVSEASDESGASRAIGGVNRQGRAKRRSRTRNPSVAARNISGRRG